MLSVREIQKQDIPLLADYWLNSDKAFMKSMGVDVTKIPPREELVSMFSQQLGQDYPQKRSYATIWLLDGKAAGHCNINKINFGEEAYMHLHLWNGINRQKGMGLQLVKMSLPYFFEHYLLQKICCEPYALNPAPNRTLEKAGFTFIKEYITTPGYLNFEQPVKHWELTYDTYRST
ncbi:MAG: GNAT family N-acetyltransferase [Bacteroidetes bacterium 46-16]|nr:MAG: GNAT family N-acetyltransferase [Bacteroidetes bacterium 46-16]